MQLINSNIIIYSANPSYSFLRTYFTGDKHFPSSIRQNRAITLADSIFAATAIATDFELITRNTEDFKIYGG